MRIDIVTLFPELCEQFLDTSILGRARKRGLFAAHCHQIRDYTANKQRQTDDYPYGGGPGMVLYAQPIADCLRAVQSACAAEGRSKPHIVFLTAAGRPYTEADAKRLAECESLTLVCGHYEGIDERVIEAFADEEVSIGDYVLTGGELAALVVADSVLRLQPGVLAEQQGYEDESYWDDLLEYPQYTRPEVWEGRAVPPVLLTGDHTKIAAWRVQQSRARTKARRPDLYERWAQNHPILTPPKWKRGEKVELVRTALRLAAAAALGGPDEAELQALQAQGWALYLHTSGGQADGLVGVRRESGEVGALFVRAQDRERGIGARLLGFACQKTEQDGKTPFLWVPAQNTAARRLFGRLGFAPDGELRSFDKAAAASGKGPQYMMKYRRLPEQEKV